MAVGEAEATGEVEVTGEEEARPDPPEAVATPTTPARTRTRMVKAGIRVKDTPPHHQKPVVNAIMSMGTKLSTVWNPQPVHG